jgi:hypothetical protein
MKTMLSIAAWLKPLEPVALGLSAAILAYQLLLQPVVGLADDGDFAKIMGQVGLRYQTEDFDARYYGFLTLTYDITPPWWPSGYLTSEIPLVAVARFYAGGFPARGVLDIRVLGALHSLVFLAGLALLLIGSRRWRPPARVVFAGLLAFVFTDVGYAALFNSLYSATASYLFLFLLAGIVTCLAGGWSSPALSVAYWIVAVCFVTSKPQESPLAVLLGLLGFLLAREGRGPGSRRAAAWLGLALSVVGALYYLRTPRYLRTEALYNNVFFELLLRSPNPSADLAELGLPPDWIAYAGTFAYLANSPLKDPAFRAEFSRRVTFRRIVGFYLNHPRRLAELLRSSARRAFRLRQTYLGNFPSSAGGKPRQWSEAFGVWSATKARLGPTGQWLLPIFWLANIAFSLRVWRSSANPSHRCLAVAVAVLVVMSIVEFLVCSVGEGLADIARHLHCFNTMTDLLLVADVAWFASVLTAIFRPTSALSPRSAREST